MEVKMLMQDCYLNFLYQFYFGFHLNQFYSFFKLIQTNAMFVSLKCLKQNKRTENIINVSYHLVRDITLL